MKTTQHDLSVNGAPAAETAANVEINTDIQTELGNFLVQKLQEEDSLPEIERFNVFAAKLNNLRTE